MRKGVGSGKAVVVLGCGGMNVVVLVLRGVVRTVALWLDSKCRALRECSCDDKRPSRLIVHILVHRVSHAQPRWTGT